MAVHREGYPDQECLHGKSAENSCIPEDSRRESHDIDVGDTEEGTTPHAGGFP